MSTKRFRLVLLSLLLAAVGSTAASEGSSANDSAASVDLTDSLKWRELGPTVFGGRISDLEAVSDDPRTIFVASASGGVFRSRNQGVTWDPVFDEDGQVLSIGDIAIAPSDSNVIWVGTGEPNNRNSSPWGGGVYKSLDGGETWQFAGLRNTHHIGRVVVHPSDPDTVFVAAVGHLWGPNSERGLYRTRDGGQTWSKVLSIDDDTGVIDVAIDPAGRILYASAYQRRRRAFGFVGGGPTSALYRSLDGGESWNRLTEGLPDGDTGRIGVSISASHPNIVYAIVENKEGGVFRSEDRGAGWTRVNKLNPRPMYYSQIRVDPTNPNKVWVLGSPLFVSIDGGKTFTSEGTAEKIHVDHHALWINPADPDHLMLGNDGGLYFSYDGGRNWDFIDNLPIAQYYAIGIDNRSPYWIYGGTQDNGSWAIPSRNTSMLGITRLDVENISYGDGFYAAIDPEDHTRVYVESQSGRLYRVDLETREEKGIRPVPEDPDEEYRFNWNSPILISPHDSSVVYYGGNKLFRSNDHGHIWTEVSPDLTRNQEWKKLPVMGVERDDDTLSRDDGIAHYGTLTTISESPLRAGLLYVGTDDGKVQMSENGGKNWTDMTESFPLPGHRWVSRVLASNHDAQTAYASFDGHRDDDFTPYLFRSSDGGSTWSSIRGDLADGLVVNSLGESLSDPNVLFAGTEFGLYYTRDGGKHWARLKGHLPRVAVDDIVVNRRDGDIVLGTHGRGIWVLDDFAALELATEGVLDQPAHIFPIRRAVQLYQMRDLPRPGARTYSAPNPPEGALITYYLKSDAPSPPPKAGSKKGDSADSSGKKPPQVEITVQDSEGNVVRKLTGDGTRGVHRIAWDLRAELSFEPTADDQGWFGPPRGPMVLPGRYSVTLRSEDTTRSQDFEVALDPRVQVSREAIESRFEASARLNQLLGVFASGGETLAEVSDERDRLQEALGENLSEDLQSKFEEIAKEIDELKKSFSGGWRSSKFFLLDLLGQLQASTTGPTASQLTQLGHLEGKLSDSIDRLNKLTGTGFPDLVASAGNRSSSSKLGPIEFPERQN